MKRYSKIIVAALIALVFLGTFVFLYMKSLPKEEVYEEFQPKVMDLSKSTVITGKIEPRDEVNVKPQISGIITAIYKVAGENVTAGEVIAKVKVIPDMGSLSAAESRVRLAKINLQQAQVDFDREKSLFDKKLVSADEYDRFSQALSQAKEEYKAAEESLEVVRDGVARSNANSSSTLVRSTVSGLILDIPVKVGNSVIQSNTFNDGTTIATVADMGDLIFDGKVDETEVGRISQGMPMTITVGALQDLSFEAVLEYISPKAMENNGTNEFEVKAAVTVPGYSANATIILERAENVIAVPESAVVYEGDSSYVFVAQKDSTYKKTSVVTGVSNGVDIEIKSGINGDEALRGNKIIE